MNKFKMKTLLFLGILTLLSCQAQKQTLVFIKHTPYCGGAKPTPEMARGTIEMAKQSKFAITLKGNTKVEKWIITDTSGTWRGKLKPGNYDVYRAEKYMTTQELISKYDLKDSEFYKFNGDKCLEIWKSQPDFTFETSNSGSVHIELKGKCYVGFRPCLDYIGPKVQ
jgi:hypothetical protein